MAVLSRRRRLILVTAGGALVFLGGAAVLAWRWGGPASTYRPGEDVEGVTSELTRSLPADYPRVVFTDVTRQAGISFRHFHGRRSSWLPEDMGSGAAWGDADGDGWVDLAIANEVGPIDASDAERRQSPARVALYHNNHDGTFTDITERTGIDFRGWGMAVAWADYDSDSHLDLLITAYGHNVLYRNKGDGTFEDRSAISGIGAPDGFWAGAAWGDYDRDGLLDLYITGYVKFTRQHSTRTDVNGRYEVENPASINPLAFPGERNLLFHNNGNGTFTELARRVGVENPTGRGMAASWVDLDEDGWPDLYVANDVSPNVLYRNLGNGKFVDVTESARVSDYRSSMGIAVGDWNGDGTQDLFLTHWLAQGNALYDNMPVRSAVQSGSTAPRRLTFMDEADRFGLGQISLDYVGWATSFIDYDNDGSLDLFVVNGSTLQSRDDPTTMVAMQSKLFWNRGTEDGFFDVSPVSGAYFRTAYVGRGGAFADYDHDGDIDAFVVNHGAPGVLLRNDGGNRNSWLQVGLRGTKSNRDGIGARIRIVSGGRQQVRYAGAQSPYLSQNAFVETFGLGRSTMVDTIEVTWPSGARDVRTAVSPNETIAITEGAAQPADRTQLQAFWALYREATAQRVAGETQRAADTYARALTLQSDHEDVLYYFGSMRLELGDFAGAARAWQHLVAVNPTSARAHSRLGALYLCLTRGGPFQIDSAERHLRTAHEINREESGPLLHLGEVALLRGDTGSARGNFSAVLATHAASGPAHFYVGYLAWKAKDMATARAHLRLATTAAPPVAAGGVPGEGDTKNGNAPLRSTGNRCGELRTLTERAAARDLEGDMSIRYSLLDSLLSAGRKRMR
jgi:tetratricopeptide (TPR) repeat protein